jgi:hypothetical protein
VIQTIRIGHLLREAAAAPYRNLVTRPTGAAVRIRIEEALAGSPGMTALLDFSGIELVDLSCADEVVAKLLLAARTAYFVVLQDSREPRLLGWVRADARRAFACVCDHGPLAVFDLCAMLRWPEPRGREALHDLAIHRLVRPIGELYHPLPTA